MDTKCSANGYLLPPIVVGLFFTIMLAIIAYPLSVLTGAAAAIIGWKILRNAPSDRRKFPRDIFWLLWAGSIIVAVAGIVVAQL